MSERKKRGKGFRFRVLVWSVLLVVSTVLFTVQPVSAMPSSNSSSESEITVDIIYASYCALDYDNIENDVYVEVVFELNNFYFYEFYYLITLQLPSGTNYTYLVYVLSLIDVVVTHNIFFDHATESGNYTVYVEALLVTPGIATDCTQFTFDPPGGSEGGKPTFGVY